MKADHALQMPMSALDDDCGRPVECAKRRLPTVAAFVIALASTVVLTLAGCASTEGIASQARPIAPAAVGIADAAAPGAPAVAPDWWASFGDPALTALIERSLVDSPTLKVAQARLARASANVGAADAARGPQVNGSLDATRQRYTATGLYPLPIAGSIRNTATLQATGSWDLDLFGRNRAVLDAAIGVERAASADRDAARVLLSSNVARTYLQLARLVEQREVALRSLAQRDELLGLIRQRVQAGIDTAVELRQGEALLPETRQQLEALDEQIGLARHALAALSVQPPNAFDTLVPRFAALTMVSPPEALPADLLGRRADISAARWRIEAATRDVDAARAQFYPNINITAFVGLSSVGLDRVLRSGSEQYGAGPAIHLPIFDAGRLRAQYARATADLDIAVADYNAAVVGAVRQTADALTEVASLADQRAQQKLALESAERAFNLASERYRLGLSGQIPMLTAEATLREARHQMAILVAQATSQRVTLLLSIGGGYTNENSKQDNKP